MEDGILKTFLETAKSLSVEERGKLLEGDSAFSGVHEELAREGATDSSEPVNHHFIALVNKDDELYELDGRKSFPIKHGATKTDTFLNVSKEI